jgi:hypothetical protein
MHDHGSQLRRPTREFSPPLLAQTGWHDEQGPFEFAAHAQDADSCRSLNCLAKTHVVGEEDPVPSYERADSVELEWQELAGPIENGIGAGKQ